MLYHFNKTKKIRSYCFFILYNIIDPLGERVDIRYTNENAAIFVPHTTGYHKVYISDYHGPILGTPFHVLIFENVQLESMNILESSGIRDTIRNQDARFTIRDKNPLIEVEIKGDLIFFTIQL
jgi:hypothetical protein